MLFHLSEGGEEWITVVVVTIMSHTSSFCDIPTYVPLQLHSKSFFAMCQLYPKVGEVKSGLQLCQLALNASFFLSWYLCGNRRSGERWVHQKLFLLGKIVVPICEQSVQTVPGILVNEELIIKQLQCTSFLGQFLRCRLQHSSYLPLIGSSFLYAVLNCLSMISQAFKCFACYNVLCWLGLGLAHVCVCGPVSTCI